jgi:hypothetical protein
VSAAHVTLKGVAGAWTVSLESGVAKPWAPDVPSFKKVSLRLTLLYLDEDPVEVAQAIQRREAELDASGRGAPVLGAEELLLSFPVVSISPWPT